jgi:hypothetical protein
LEEGAKHVPDEEADSLAATRLFHISRTVFHAVVSDIRQMADQATGSGNHFA